MLDGVAMQETLPSRRRRRVSEAQDGPDERAIHVPAPQLPPQIVPARRRAPFQMEVSQPVSQEVLDCWEWNIDTHSTGSCSS